MASLPTLSEVCILSSTPSHSSFSHTLPYFHFFTELNSIPNPMLICLSPIPLLDYESCALEDTSTLFFPIYLYSGAVFSKKVLAYDLFTEDTVSQLSSSHPVLGAHPFSFHSSCTLSPENTKTQDSPDLLRGPSTSDTDHSFTPTQCHSAALKFEILGGGWGWEGL